MQWPAPAEPEASTSAGEGEGGDTLTSLSANPFRWRRRAPLRAVAAPVRAQPPSGRPSCNSLRDRVSVLSSVFRGVNVRTPPREEKHRVCPVKKSACETSYVKCSHVTQVVCYLYSGFPGDSVVYMSEWGGGQSADNQIKK